MNLLPEIDFDNPPTPDDVRKEAERQGLDPELAVSVAKTESNGNPRARSKVGAQGIFQLMPATGQEVARKMGETYNPNDAHQNVRLGVKYLRERVDKFGGDYSKAVSAYNAGDSRVAQAGGIPNIKETRDYERKVKSTYNRIAGGKAAQPVQPATVAKTAPAMPEIDDNQEIDLGASAPLQKVSKVQLPALPTQAKPASATAKPVPTNAKTASATTYEPGGAQEAAVLTRAHMLNQVGKLRQEAPHYNAALDSLQADIESAFSADTMRGTQPDQLKQAQDAASAKFTDTVKTINADMVQRRQVQLAKQRAQQAAAKQKAEQSQQAQYSKLTSGPLKDQPGQSIDLLAPIRPTVQNPATVVSSQLQQQENARQKQVAASLAKPQTINLKPGAPLTSGPLQTADTSLMDRFNDITGRTTRESLANAVPMTDQPQMLSEMASPKRPTDNVGIFERGAEGVYNTLTGKQTIRQMANMPNPRQEQIAENARDYEQALAEHKTTIGEAQASPRLREAVFNRAEQLKNEREFEQGLDISHAIKRQENDKAAFESNPVTLATRMVLSKSTADFVADKIVRGARGAVNAALDIPEGIALMAAVNAEQFSRGSGLDTKAQRQLFGSAARIAERISLDMGLGQARAAVNRNLVNDPRRAEGLEGFIGDTVEGIASMAPMALASWLTTSGAAAAFATKLETGAALKLTQLGLKGVSGLTAATMGLLQNSAAQYQDAKQHGASDDAAMASAKLGALFGLSEGIGLPQKLTELGVLRPLVKHLLEHAEEMGQEMFTQTMQNLTANLFVGYDPERGWDDGVLKAGVIGFMASAGISGAEHVPHLAQKVASKTTAMLDRLGASSEAQVEVTRQALQNPQVQQAAQQSDALTRQAEHLMQVVAEDQKRMKRGELSIQPQAAEMLPVVQQQAMQAEAALDSAVAGLQPPKVDISTLKPAEQEAALMMEQITSGKAVAPIPANATADEVKEIYRQRAQDFGPDSVAAAQAWNRYQALNPDMMLQVGKDRFYSLPDAEALLSRLGNDIGTPGGLKQIDQFLRKNKIQGVTAEDIAGDYLTPAEAQSDDLRHEYEKLGLPTNGQPVQAGNMARVEADNPSNPDTGGRVIDLEAERAKIDEQARQVREADAQEQAMLADLEQRAAERAAAKAQADEVEKVRLAEQDKAEREAQKLKAKQAEAQKVIDEKAAVQAESQSLVDAHRQKYTAALSTNDYVGAVRSLKQIEAQINFQLREKPTTPQEAAQRAEREADLEDLQREIKRVQKLADTGVENGAPVKPSGPLFSNMASDPEYIAQQKRMDTVEADRKWINLAEESRNRKLTTDEQNALKSPIEYLKLATKREGIKVGASGERAMLGAKESGIVGLTNKASQFSTADAAVMLDEGGFTMPDGRKFTDDSVTENDVIDYLINNGKTATSQAADLDAQLAEEEAAYYAKKEAEGSAPGVSPDTVGEYESLDKELNEFDQAQAEATAAQPTSVTGGQPRTAAEVGAMGSAETGTGSQAVFGAQDDGAVAPSASPFVRLREATREQVAELARVSARSSEGQAITKALYQYAKDNGIEARHVDALIQDAYNSALDAARQADRDAREILGEKQYKEYEDKLNEASERFDQLADRIARGFETPQIKRAFLQTAQEIGLTEAEAREVLNRARLIARRRQESGKEAQKRMDAGRAGGRRASWEAENTRLTATYGGKFFDSDGHEYNARILNRTGRNQVVIEFRDRTGDLFDRFVTTEYYLEAGLFGAMGLEQVGRAVVGISAFERMTEPQLRHAMAELNQLYQHGWEEMRALTGEGDMTAIRELEAKQRDLRDYLEEGGQVWDKRGMRPQIAYDRGAIKDELWYSLEKDANGKPFSPEEVKARKAERQRQNTEAARKWADEIAAKANEAATSETNDTPQPTEPQQDAGNYRHGKFSWNGLEISIENPAGSTRSGVDANGKVWSVTMQNHYGYIRRSGEGADGENIDVYMGNHPDSQKVFVVNQNNLDGSFDEHKVVLGALDRAHAEAMYDAHFNDGKGSQRRGSVVEMALPEFKDWIKQGDKKVPADLLSNKQPQEMQQDSAIMGAETALPANKIDAADVAPENAPLVKPEAPLPKATTPRERSISELLGELERGRVPELTDKERVTVEARRAKYQAAKDAKLAPDIAKLSEMLGEPIEAPATKPADGPITDEGQAIEQAKALNQALVEARQGGDAKAAERAILSFLHSVKLKADAQARVRAELPEYDRPAAKAEAKPAEAPGGTIPPQVRQGVERAINTLKAAAEELERGRALDQKFKGEGRYEAETFEKLDTKAAEQTIATFREHAPQNGVDAEALLNELGGVPDVSLSKAAKEWQAETKPATEAPAEPEAPLRKSTVAQQRSVSELLGELEKGRAPELSEKERAAVEARRAKYIVANDAKLTPDIAKLDTLLGNETKSGTPPLHDTTESEQSQGGFTTSFAGMGFLEKFNEMDKRDLARLFVQHAQSFKAWSGAMLKRFGAEIKPHLRAIWDGVKAFIADEGGRLSVGAIQQWVNQQVNKVGQPAAKVAVAPTFDLQAWGKDLLGLAVNPSISAGNRAKLAQAFQDGMRAVAANDGAALWEARREAARLAETEASTKGQKAIRIGQGVLKLAWNISRGLMAGGEVSPVGRQGGWNFLAHPVKSGQALWAAKDALAVWESAGDYLKAVGALMRGKVRGDQGFFRQMGQAGDDAYNRALALLEQHPRYAAARKAELRLATSEEGALHPKYLTGGEENFSVGALNALPVMRQLERLNKIFLDMQRLHAFDALTRTVDLTKGAAHVEEEYKRAAAEVNRATGQANIKESLQGATSAAAAGFFSPRWFISRFQMLNPYQYVRGVLPGATATDVAVMKDRWKAVAMMGVYASTVGGIVVGLGGSIGWRDPDDKDFLKARLGDTRFSLLPAGIGTYVTFLLRMGKRAYKYNETGDPKESQKAAEQFGRFMRTKESPNVSLLHDQLFARSRDKGEWETIGHNAIGESRTLKESIKERLFPIYWKNLAEVFKRDNAGKMGVGLEFFGLDTNTFGDKEYVGRGTGDDYDPKNLTYAEKKKARQQAYDATNKMPVLGAMPKDYQAELRERQMDDALREASARKEGKQPASSDLQRAKTLGNIAETQSLQRFADMPAVKAMSADEQRAAKRAFNQELGKIGRSARGSEKRNERLPDIISTDQFRDAALKAIQAGKQANP